MSGPPTFPGARRPDRTRRVSSGGLGLAVHEWGEEGAPPILLAHGGFDFAGTYDVFAPLLAEAGWRVVCWDQRGHGNSDAAALYSFEADVRDAHAVLAATADRPIPIIGHSKGGALLLQLADAAPHRVSHVVNLDGLPVAKRWPDVADHERTRLRGEELRRWLELRAAAGDKQRRPGTISELAKRRQAMNPRLDLDWLEYLVPIGAVQVGDEELWRWRVDPVLRMGGFGPWRPEWSTQRLPGLSQPLLAILATEAEPLGWGATIADVEPWMPPQASVVELSGVGHFVHVERPNTVAELVLDFLGPPPTGGAWAPVDLPPLAPPPGDGGVAARPPSEIGDDHEVAALRPHEVRLVRHSRVELALHTIRAEDEAIGGHPLLLLHGLGERTPVEEPPWLTSWTGSIYGLDFTGHGRSSVPVGGGYTPEQLMVDASVAVSKLGQATVLGRGLGAYVALLLAAGRPDAVLGAVLADGSGLSGGGAAPGSASVATIDARRLGRPDPFAVAELARDVRPDDYAGTFARLALEQSSLDQPLIVSAVTRPPWLEAVAREPGVGTMSLTRALAFYTRLGFDV